MIDQLAKTPNGARGLIQVASVTGNKVNSIVFFICAMHYRAHPSKTKAALIHGLFLEMAQPQGHTSTDQWSIQYLSVKQESIGGANNYRAYRQNYVTKIALPQAQAVGMNPLKRMFTSGSRKAPRDLFDGLLEPVRQNMRPFVSQNLNGASMFDFAKNTINGFRVGNQGGGADREQGQYRKMVNWADEYANKIDQSGCFSATALGIRDVFAPQNLT